jgi:hypothetical protein
MVKYLRQITKNVPHARKKEAIKSFQTSRSLALFPLSRPHTAWFNPESVFVTGGCGKQMVERSSAAHYCAARLLGAFATSAPVAHWCPAGCLLGACLLSHRTRRQHYPLYYILTRIDFRAEGQRCTKSSNVQQLTLVTTDHLIGGAVTRGKILVLCLEFVLCWKFKCRLVTFHFCSKLRSVWMPGIHF